jgi:hypothetical protein
MRQATVPYDVVQQAVAHTRHGPLRDMGKNLDLGNPRVCELLAEALSSKMWSPSGYIWQSFLSNPARADSLRRFLRALRWNVPLTVRVVNDAAGEPESVVLTDGRR